MSNSAKCNYRRLSLFASLSVMFLCGSTFVSKFDTNVVKTYCEQPSCQKEEVFGRILGQAGVQGVISARNELIGFRRRSVYYQMDKLMDCLFRGFLDTLMWFTEEVYKSDGSGASNDTAMIEKIIRKQMYTEGVTLSNRTVTNEVQRTKERHDEIAAQGTTSEVVKRMMKLYEYENNLSKETMKKVSAPHRTESIHDILNAEKIKLKIKKKLETMPYTYDDAIIDSVAARIIGRVTDISKDENIM
ncbi:gametocyte associated protein, putative [Plasmodium vivax]|uniref:Gametocyte associated protein, putative n=2 Tax=Plasmodium vivax TaxID=5855 RepID=A0A1G4HJF7_PLAVI|nr:gap [Plasmodium vivax North Korean]SCO75097.1 gametocyte associated protein, putative [Plasmodium vivax]